MRKTSKEQPSQIRRTIRKIQLFGGSNPKTGVTVKPFEHVLHIIKESNEDGSREIITHVARLGVNIFLVSLCRHCVGKDRLYGNTLKTSIFFKEMLFLNSVKKIRAI